MLYVHEVLVGFKMQIFNPNKVQLSRFWFALCCNWLTQMIKSDTVSQSSDSLLSLIVAVTKQLPKHSMLIIREKDWKVACVCECMRVRVCVFCWFRQEETHSAECFYDQTEQPWKFSAVFPQGGDALRFGLIKVIFHFGATFTVCTRHVLV